MGPAAFAFVDFLRDAGQSVWQILPLCPTSIGNSPYSSYSAFAGNMLLLSPESLVAEDWLSSAELEEISRLCPGLTTADPSQAEFDSAEAFKRKVAQAAFATFVEKRNFEDEFDFFCGHQAWWLDDFARFEALSERFETNNWNQWPTECHDPKSIAGTLLAELETAIKFSKFKQFLFDRQWTRLKDYAHQRSIQICGDMPIFVAFESADVWANQDQFLLDADGRPNVVAGVPPDYFSETGQLWGNPLYDWQKMESDDFVWWTRRFRRSLDQFDLLRLDHFRGFANYWEIPADAQTAAAGQWKRGPQAKPFIAAEKSLGKLPIWAEDLGDIDQPVHDLRNQLGFPSMRVLQFGYDQPHDDFHRHTALPQDCIAYTGTHDNQTLMGWYDCRTRSDNQNNNEPDVLAEFLEGPQDVHLQMIKLLYDTDAIAAIIPLQDALALGAEARMNVPGTADGNWRWRMRPEALTPVLANQLKELTSASGRLNSLIQSPV